ncbi:MAG: hypothetical protein JO023_02100 [Chloroflexi bacterium]|nr:hypothetical protein [Chloroflexota bacterium]
MGRWPAVALGCLTALGIQALLTELMPHLGIATPAYGVLFVALVLAGFVTGHLAGETWYAFNGALAAVAYILVAATLTTIREASAVRTTGIFSLAPIDYVGLALGDLVALTGASLGGWLAGLGAAPAPPRGLP